MRHLTWWHSIVTKISKGSIIYLNSLNIQVTFTFYFSLSFFISGCWICIFKRNAVGIVCIQMLLLFDLLRMNRHRSWTLNKLRARNKENYYLKLFKFVILYLKIIKTISTKYMKVLPPLEISENSKSIN